MIFIDNIIGKCDNSIIREVVQNRTNLRPHPPIRRGVRSGVQLSCTETRFQKCSQSGKIDSKHPMLSIPMAYNVFSCQKIERNTPKIKLADLIDKFNVFLGNHCKFQWF